MITAWYYNRGKLIEIPGEHPGVIAKVYKGYARIRYHEDLDTLAVQARSKNIVKRAIDTYLDSGLEIPEKINAEWPGKYIECFFSEWR